LNGALELAGEALDGALEFSVISWPTRGTALRGVDTAAAEANPRIGTKSLFVLSIKSGNLTRSQWSEGVEGASNLVEEILDGRAPPTSSPTGPQGPKP
jgi:hypothetical protein